MRLHTRLVHAPACGDPFRAAATPVYQTATFALDGDTLAAPYDYSRSGNPTRATLEAQLAALEGGERAFAFASGLAALTAVLRLVPTGGEVVADDDLYGGTYRLLSHLAPRQGVRTRYTDACDLAAVARACAGRPRLILVESLTNPHLRAPDIAGLARVAHAHGAWLCVDNSARTPLRCRPLEHGADLVVHSATKYLGGHGDVTAGIVVTREPALAELIGGVQNGEGAVLAPFETFLLLRGLQTLAVRLRQQERSARAVASLLACRPEVERVFYPRTEDGAFAPGGGAVVSFTTGCLARTRRFLAALRLLSCAVSFGSVRSSACLPGAMSHASVPEGVRRRRGFAEDLVRLSIGIEDAADILDDLRQALAASATGSSSGVEAQPACARIGAGRHDAARSSHDPERRV